MDAKVDNFLSKISLDDDMENMEDMPTISLNIAEMQPSSADSDPYEVLTSRSLSTVGDNPRAKVGFISFDGNFQHKHFPM